MSNHNFSIDITSLPATDGLGPVDAENAASTVDGGLGIAQKQKPTPVTRPKGHSISSGVQPNDPFAPSSQMRTPNPFAAAADRPSSPAAPAGSSMSQALGGSSSGMPRRSSSPFGGRGSPNPNNALRSASPRHLSPATSQIFERDVQESTVNADLASAIPSHIQTEDAIPPVLEASSLAITDTRLKPEDVEIVMHSSHQPAALGVAGGGGGLGELQQPSSAFASHSDLGLGGAGASDPHLEESGNARGEVDALSAMDPLDPRRLSFISYADIVHAEQVADSGNSSGSQQQPLHPLHFTALPGGARSPSPSRPRQGSMLGTLEEGVVRRGSASIASPFAQTHGDVTIETMRHALDQPLNVAAGEGGGTSRA